VKSPILSVVVFSLAFVAALPAVEPGKPSLSALEVTAYRAIGAKHPDPAIRNGDSLAERFLGPEQSLRVRDPYADPAHRHRVRRRPGGRRTSGRHPGLKTPTAPR
jgi:hypothetical protein